jgi:hypothetical protein
MYALGLHVPFLPGHAWITKEVLEFIIFLQNSYHVPNTGTPSRHHTARVFLFRFPPNNVRYSLDAVQ